LSKDRKESSDDPSIKEDKLKLHRINYNSTVSEKEKKTAERC